MSRKNVRQNLLLEFQLRWVSRTAVLMNGRLINWMWHTLKTNISLVVRMRNRSMMGERELRTERNALQTEYPLLKVYDSELFLSDMLHSYLVLLQKRKPAN
jgi:hypothetical protein